MTIEVQGDLVRMTGRCGVEEAETLLPALAGGARRVDLSGCEHLHAAIVQLLMAARPVITGAPSDFLFRWIVPILDPGQDTPAEQPL